MEKEILKEKDYAEELVYIIRKNLQEKKPQELLEKLSDYHENDIAEALTRLTVEERRALYPILGVERVAEIFAYLDEDEQEYFKELSIWMRTSKSTCRSYPLTIWRVSYRRWIRTMR